MRPAQEYLIDVIDPALCRRCVRNLSSRLRDIPGVVAFEVDVAAGRVRIAGDVQADAVRSAIARSAYR